MSNDNFTGTNDNDTFNGGEGTDTVTFAGTSAGYRFETLADGRIHVVDIDNTDGDTGADILTGIDTLSFSDRDFSLRQAGNFDPQGEFRVATGTGTSPVITALANGGYVIAWTTNGADGSSWGIYAQRFDANGNTVGAKALVNTHTAGTQAGPAATTLAGGDYVITWTSQSQDGSEDGIYAQRFNADGNKVGVETLVNTTTAGNQNDSDVTALADGGYVVTWTDDHGGNVNSDVYAQRFDASGAKVGSEVRINTTTRDYQYSSDVTALSDGGYVISWSNYDFDQASPGTCIQRYDASGVKVGGEVFVNGLIGGGDSSITALSDGGYVVTWNDTEPGFASDIYAQRYNAAGNKVGSAVRVNTFRDFQVEPTVTALSDGGYVITWESDWQDGSLRGIYAQRFDASGSKVGGEIRVNVETEESQTMSDVTALADGGFVITWTSEHDHAVHARRFDAEGTRWESAAFRITGTAGDDTIIAGAGKQVLAGGAGADILVGGLDDDTYILADNDTVTEVAGQGTDTVQASLSYTLGANVENLTLTGSAAINGAGNTLNNILTGNAAGNILNGGTGIDQLLGGLGNDTYILADNDVVIENANAGADTVQVNFSYTLGANLERLTLTGSAAINGTGNSLNNILTGGSGVNSLNGVAGNDTLNGGNGADTLNGGSGNDSLSGGAGADNFRFNGTLNASTNVDTIQDFSVGGGDVIQLDNAIFKKLTALGALKTGNFQANTSGAAIDSNDYILYETDTGKLFYDADGNGVGAKVQFALIGASVHPALTAADFVVI